MGLHQHVLGEVEGVVQVGSGLYFYRLLAGTEVVTRKMLLLK